MILFSFSARKTWTPHGFTRYDGRNFKPNKWVVPCGQDGLTVKSVGPIPFGLRSNVHPHLGHLARNRSLKKQMTPNTESSGKHTPPALIAHVSQFNRKTAINGTINANQKRRIKYTPCRTSAFNCSGSSEVKWSVIQSVAKNPVFGKV